MITIELINEIKRELSRGKSREDIRKALRQEGWVMDDIEEGFAETKDYLVSAKEKKEKTLWEKILDYLKNN